MRIRITAEGRSVTVELEQELAQKVFSDIVLQLLRADGILSASEPLEGEIKERLQSPSLNKSVVEKPHKKLEGLNSYKGFLYVKCPKCGTVRGFCAKEQMDGYHCFECGADMPFTKELVPLHINCQCGGRFKYMTNITDNAFDVNCLECGAPVAVCYNTKKKLYETIREE